MLSEVPEYKSILNTLAKGYKSRPFGAHVRLCGKK